MSSHCISIRLIAIIALAVLACAAQEPNDIHVQPRSKPADKPLPQRSDSALTTHTKPFVSNVDVVLVPVTVMDPLTRIVTGLERHNFQILEDNKPQQIEYFYSQDAPISVGIILDTSGSIGDAINDSREAVVQFMKKSNPDDEYFLISFANKPKLMGDFTENPDEIQGKLVYTVTSGLTGLWDAVYLGLSKMRSAKYERKALLVISDGGENNSRYTYQQMLRFLREADVQLYGIGVFGADYGPQGMIGLSESTGGRFFQGAAETFADTAEKIATELRNQYVLGYRPKDFKHDGKFHKIRIKLSPPSGLPPLHASWRKTGYYAPED